MALQLKIQTTVSDANALEKVIKNLEKLRSLNAPETANGVARAMNRLSVAMAKMREVKGPSTATVNNLNSLVKVINSLRNDIPDLTPTVESLRGLADVRISKTSATNLESLIKTASTANVGKGFTDFRNALKSLNDIKIPKGIGTIGKSMLSMVEATDKLKDDFAPKIAQLSKALTPLSKLPKSNLSSYITPLSKLGQAISDINATKTRELDTALAKVKQLTYELEKLGGTKVRTGASVNRQSAAESGGDKKSGLGTMSLLGVVGKVMAAGFAIKVVSDKIKSAVDASNEFVENMNLFTVAMGKYAQEADRYADKVQETLGIDKSEWIRNQGLFKQILSGFGVNEDLAFKYSKVLNQLTYDITSFFDISSKEAHQKVASGIAGELEPLRRLGYALDQATLQQVAYRHGIELSVREMTQAEKAQLRMMAIYEQSKNVMTDLSRTVMTPANAMRIFESQVHRLKRSFANGLIPVIMAVMPYLQTLVQLLTMAANALASFLGFKLPKIKYEPAEVGAVGDLADNMGEVADNTGKAHKAAKEFKAFLAGFDQLHVIPEPPKEPEGGGGGKGGAGIGGGPRFNLDVPDYDFLSGTNKRVERLVNKVKKLFDKVKDFLKPILPMLDSIARIVGAGLGFGLIAEWLGKILGLSDKWRLLLKGVGLVAGAIWAGYHDAYNKTRQYLDGTLTGFEYGLSLLGNWLVQTGLIYLGLQKIGSALNLASFLGVSAGAFNALLLAIAAVTAAVVAFKGAWDATIDHVIQKNYFGDIKLSAEDIENILNRMTQKPYYIKLGLANDALSEVRSTVDGLHDSLSDLRIMNISLKMGLDYSLDEIVRTAEAAIKAAEDYLAAQKKYIGLSVNLAFGEGDESNSMFGKLTMVPTELENQIRELKAKLYKVFSDETMSETEKSEAAKKIARDLQDVMAQVEKYQQEWQQHRDMHNLFGEIKGEVSFDDTNIDWESFKNLMVRAQEMGQEHASQIRLHFSGLKASADIELDEGHISQAEYDELIKRLENEQVAQEFKAKVKPAIEMVGNFGKKFTEQLERFYGDAVDGIDLGRLSMRVSTAMKKVGEDIFDSLKPDIIMDDVALWLSVSEMFDNMAEELGISSTQFKGVMNRMWANVFEDSHTIIKNEIATLAEHGQYLDEETLKFFEQATLTAAGAGEEWATAMLSGLEVSKRDEWAETLQSMHDSGQEIPDAFKQGFLANIGQVLQDIQDGTVPLTDDIKELLRMVGFELPDSFVEGLGKGKNMASETDKKLKEINKAITSNSSEFVKLLKAMAESGSSDFNTTLKNMKMPPETKKELEGILGSIQEKSPDVLQALGHLGKNAPDKFLEAIKKADMSNISKAEVEAIATMLNQYSPTLGDSFKKAAAESGNQFVTSLKASKMGDVTEAQLKDAKGRVVQQETGIKTALGNVGSGGGDSFNSAVRNAKMSNVVEQELDKVEKKADGFGSRIGRALGGIFTWIGEQLGIVNRNIDNTVKRTNNVRGGAGTTTPRRGASAGMFASGGFPSMGQMFIAREAGPELVGTLGGRTAVANNSQIITSISRGVFQATSSAMMGFGARLAATIGEISAINNPQAGYSQDEADSQYDDRLTREDFAYGLNALTQAVIEAIDRNGDKAIEMDGEAVGRVVTRYQNRTAVMEG